MFGVTGHEDWWQLDESWRFDLETALLLRVWHLPLGIALGYAGAWRGARSWIANWFMSYASRKVGLPDIRKGKCAWNSLRGRVLTGNVLDLYNICVYDGYQSPSESWLC